MLTTFSNGTVINQPFNVLINDNVDKATNNTFTNEYEVHVLSHRVFIPISYLWNFFKENFTHYDL